MGDVAGDDASVARLGLQAPVDSAIEVARDADVYRVAVEAGRTYLFELEGAATAGGTLANAGLSLRYAGGVDIRHDEGGGVGGNARLEFTPATDGEILVVATGVGDEGNTGSYRLSVTMEPPALSDDLPLFVDGEPLPAAAIQQETYSNGPEAGGEVFATWLGGSGQLDSAVGAFMPGWDSDPMIAFASTSALNSGDAVSLGWGAPGLFLLPGEAALGAELAALPAGSLALLDGNTGEPVTLDDGASPQLVRVDGQSPVVVADDMLFAVGGHGRDIGAPVEHPEPRRVRAGHRRQLLARRDRALPGRRLRGNRLRRRPERRRFR
ncbi:MAG: hypothetical protein U1E14_14560 [Geminicoccaceae bacterium]